MKIHWTRDEIIIVMAYYLRYRHLGASLPKYEKQKLSELFRTFDFHETYGDYGQGYIECHHNIPLSELHIDAPRKTTLDDLSLLCANCHRMVHYANPWAEVADIRHMVQS